MSQVIIENPVLNSPFVAPTKHFKFTSEGITDQVLNARRVSSYFMLIPRFAPIIIANRYKIQLGAVAWASFSVKA
ncbi:MAG: hypothetical protein ACR2LC_10230 [Pyrinomonadaceae bacterium]